MRLSCHNRCSAISEMFGAKLSAMFGAKLTSCNEYPSLARVDASRRPVQHAVDEQQCIACGEVHLNSLGTQLSRTVRSHDLVLRCATNGCGVCLSLSDV